MTFVRFCWVGLSALSVLGCSQAPSPVLTRLMDARRHTADLMVSFAKAEDAANRAVMADTDDASVAFAREAQTYTDSAQREVAALDKLVVSLGYGDETKLVAAFREAFTKYRALDREILALAVENTNLKAQRLSFGAGREAADALRAALSDASAGVAAKDVWQVRALAQSAILAVRDIEVLEGPHIAAAEDATMTELEKQMAASAASAQSSLAELAQVGSPALQTALSGANQAFTRFMTVHAQVVALSRRNTNVQSLALSLGQKHALAATCDGSLQALGDALAKRDFPATR